MNDTKSDTKTTGSKELKSGNVATIFPILAGTVAPINGGFVGVVFDMVTGETYHMTGDCKTMEDVQKEMERKGREIVGPSMIGPTISVFSGNGSREI